MAKQTIQRWQKVNWYLSPFSSPSLLYHFLSYFSLLSIVVVEFSLNILYFTACQVLKWQYGIYGSHSGNTALPVSALAWNSWQLFFSDKLLYKCRRPSCTHATTFSPPLKLRLTNRATSNSFRNNVKGSSNTAATSQTDKRESRNSRRHSINKNNSTMQYEKLQEVI